MLTSCLSLYNDYFLCSGFANLHRVSSIQNPMEDYILATRYLSVIFILISFPSTSILGYCVTMTVLELKVDRLSGFLDTTSISHILTRMLPLDNGPYLSKILWKTVYWQLGVRSLFSFSSLFFLKVFQGFIYPKSYRRPYISNWVFGHYSYFHLFFLLQVFQTRRYFLIRQPIFIFNWNCCF